MHASRFLFFFFNDTATTEIYTLSLHDALPICICSPTRSWASPLPGISAASFLRSAIEFPTFPRAKSAWRRASRGKVGRSEEHTSELQSRPHLVCRLLLEKKKTDLIVAADTFCS